MSHNENKRSGIRFGRKVPMSHERICFIAFTLSNGLLLHTPQNLYEDWFLELVFSTNIHSSRMKRSFKLMNDWCDFRELLCELIYVRYRGLTSKASIIIIIILAMMCGSHQWQWWWSMRSDPAQIISRDRFLNGSFQLVIQYATFPDHSHLFLYVLLPYRRDQVRFLVLIPELCSPLHELRNQATTSGLLFTRLLHRGPVLEHSSFPWTYSLVYTVVRHSFGHHISM